MDPEVYAPSACIASRAAELYFVEGASQREICDRLGVSVSTVSRLVNRAREESLVSIAIAEPYASCLRLERDLKAAYHLKEVLVPPNLSPDPHEANRAVAIEGARLVQRLTTSKDTLGVAWGGTVRKVIHYLNPCRKIPASFVALHGSIPCYGADLNPQSLVERMAMAFGGRQRALDHPGLQPTEADVARLLAEPDVARLYDLYEGITISLASIGSFRPELASRLAYNYLAPDELQNLLEAGVVGDLVLRFFDGAGQECDTDLSDRTLAIPFDQYRRIPFKLVVASGELKALTLHAALEGGLVDALVVDESLARAVAQLKGVGPRS